MDLTVVVGAHEYLRPNRLNRQKLQEIASSISPGAIVPQLAWTRHDEEPYLDAWLRDTDEESARRTALLRDYLRDMYAPDASLWLVVPFASVLRDGSADVRTQWLLEEVRAWDAVDTLRVLHLSLSRRADEALRTLASRAQGLEPPPPEGSPLGEVVHLHDRGPWEGTPELVSNYNRALLRCAESFIPASTIYGTSFRADRVGRSLERSGLYVRADAEPEDVVAQLSPGGELFEALARPFGA